MILVRVMINQLEEMENRNRYGRPSKKHGEGDRFRVTMGEGAWESFEGEGMGDVEKEFEEEIKRAIWELGPIKDPGLDGFLIVFFRTFWREVKGDLKWLLEEVFRRQAKLDRINFSIISLIPKKGSPERIWDCRLIALLNST